jgi:signal transduction histidine kinase
MIVEDQIKAINTLMKLGDYQKVIALSESFLKNNCNNIKILTTYGKALIEVGYYEKACDILESVLEIVPNDVKALNTYAEALAKLKWRREEAVDIYNKLLELEPRNHITHATYATLLTILECYEKASIHFRIALGLDPDNYQTLCNYAINLAKQRRYKDSFKNFDKALRLTNKYSHYINLLRKYGGFLVEAGFYKKACEIFEEYLKHQKNNYVYFKYARALEELRKYQEAISQLEAIRLADLPQYHANVIRVCLGRLYYCIKQPEIGNEYFELAEANSDDKEQTLLYSARSILASNHHNEKAVEMLRKIAENSPRYAQAVEMLTLNLSEKEYYDMVKNNVRTGLSETEVLNRAMYHKIANEISILKGIAYRILRYSEQEDPLLSCIIQDIEKVSEEVDRRRAAQKSEIETIPHDDYGNILAVISKTAHDISDFVNNELSAIESKTRRAIRKLQPSDVHYSQFEKLLAQLELTQTALNDLKAINEGITIKNHRFKVKKLFEKWENTPRIEQAQIILNIQNGDSEFNGDEEKIKSALNELVENSLKHNFEQQNLIISISSNNVINPSGIRGRTIPGEQKYLFIEFADNGKGIPEDKKDWIFQPLKTTSQEGKGSGLGLFIIRKTLTKMNGYIRETGYNGARFEIYIPYTKGEVH